jgi:hypothetical protein
LWVLTAAAGFVTLIGHTADVPASARWQTQLTHPTYVPLAALVVVVPYTVSTLNYNQPVGSWRRI